MKRTAAILIQILIALIGAVVLAALLYEPQVEGVNAHRTQFQIYLQDPFIAYIYLAFVPFFIGLYQLFHIVSSVRNAGADSSAVKGRLRIIQFCGLAMALMIGGAVAYLVIFVRGNDDIAGGVMMGLFIIVVSLMTAASAFFYRVRAF